MGKSTHTRFRCHDIPQEGEHRCLALLPVCAQSLIIEDLVLDNLNESDRPPEGRERRVVLE